MIPKKEERQKTLVEAFIEGISIKQYEGERWSTFLRALESFFHSVMEAVQSYDEWHEKLADLNVILVRKAERKPGRILTSYEARRWCEPSSRFLAIKNPAELDDSELMLVPEKTIEKLIVLGELKP